MGIPPASFVVGLRIVYGRVRTKNICGLQIKSYWWKRFDRRCIVPKFRISLKLFSFHASSNFFSKFGCARIKALAFSGTKNLESRVPSEAETIVIRRKVGVNREVVVGRSSALLHPG